MASRMLARLCAEEARSAARGHRLPAGHLRGPSLAGSMGGLSTISPAIQIRFGSGGAMSSNKLEELAERIQALERAGAMSDKVVKLAERRAVAAEKRAVAAERRADAAERRAELVEGRMERLEHIFFTTQTHFGNHVRFTSVQFASILRLLQDVERNLKVNFAVSAHSYWTFSKEFDKLRLQMSEMKAEYMNEVLSAKAAVSASSWRIVMVLLGAFGAITIYYLPYVVNDVKTEILKEVGKVMKEMLQPVSDQVIEMKQQQGKKSRWF